MHPSSLTRLCLVFAILGAVTLGTSAAFAHERRAIGKYSFVVGFSVEPPVEGEKNGVDLRVSTGDPAKPVEGVEKTLKVEVSQGTVSHVFDLRALFNDPGHYAADLIPTAPGGYTFRFVGTIDGTPIDERFQSGPGRFNDVQSAQDLQFPEKLPALGEVAGVARDNQETARNAADAASSARKVAIAGLVAGGAGIVLGAGGVALALKRH